jgi:hypothetical protein
MKVVPTPRKSRGFTLVVRLLMMLLLLTILALGLLRYLGSSGQLTKMPAGCCGIANLSCGTPIGEEKGTSHDGV